MYPCTCMSPFIMSYCRRVVILTFIFHDGLRVSLFIQPSNRPKRRRKGGIFDGERLHGHLQGYYTKAFENTYNVK